MKKPIFQLMPPGEQIAQIISRIYKSGMTTTSGGNISLTDNDENIWITPSMIDKGTLTEKDIVCVKKTGDIKGRHKPSSELPFHKAIYSARPDIKAIIHAHPPGLVSFSIVRKKPDMNITPHTKNICGTAGYSVYALTGGEELGKKIAYEFKKGHNCIIMENHGAVAGGTDLTDAYTKFETFEYACRIIIGAGTLGKPLYLKDEQIEQHDSHLKEVVPEKDKANHNDAEHEIRQNISDLLNRACAQGLLYGTSGSVSVRLNNNDFLITPAHMPRWEINADDLVKIREGKRVADKFPDRNAQMHFEIYRRHLHVNSIITAQPENIMAFGVTNKHLDVRTIPESWIFLKDIPLVRYGAQFEDIDAFSGSFTPDTPAVIVRNDSITVTGDKLLQAFERLEVAEFSAKSLIMSKALGRYIPLCKKDIDDLRKKFF